MNKGYRSLTLLMRGVLRLRAVTSFDGRLLLAAAVLAGAMVTRADGFLFDFGAPETQTVPAGAGTTRSWNNVDASVGANDFGFLPDLILTDGSPTTISFQMVSRFNGANENGTLGSTLYPAAATRDSLYGNTELWSGLENVMPTFKLTGLTSGLTYKLTFYASRTGVSDNRETRYTVTGATEKTADLDAANNVNSVVAIEGVSPDAAGEVTVALSPGPNNNNANHFTYLGVLRVDASDGTSLVIDLGASGTPTENEEPAAPTSWNNVVTSVATSNSGELAGLVTTNGTVTKVGLQMIARFNGANTAGATTSTVYPSSATRDSLFGNTEAFSGLANIFPKFKLTGLDSGSVYTFTFYGSRTGASDNRETRYTVAGAKIAYGDLNTANNVDGAVTVGRIAPDAAGEITVELTPGPNNNNANHFTYLGVMEVGTSPVRSPSLLIDLGAAATTTEFGAGDPENYWNNVSAIGTSDTGELAGLVMTDGTVTGMSFRMVARFNGVNESGTTTSTLYPSSATRDSLFANVEAFNSLENVVPVFKLAGLSVGTAYDLTFYASRLGVGDNRETRYTVAGAAEVVADLNASNNETETVKVSGMLPNAAGEISVTLTPGPNNDNANHFTYLGVLRVDWVAAAPADPAVLSEMQYGNGQVSFVLTGTVGKSYVVQRTSDFARWTDVQTVPLGSASQRVQIAATDPVTFYRAIAP